MRDDDIRALGYEPTRKGWVSNRLSGQLNGQLSLLEAKRWSPATVVAYLRLPPSMARTYAVAMALGNGINREGSRGAFRGGRDQVASVISGTKRKRICAILGMEAHSFSNFARDCDAISAGDQRQHQQHSDEQSGVHKAPLYDSYDPIVSTSGSRVNAASHLQHLGPLRLRVDDDLERELSTSSLNYSSCGLGVHWVSGLANTPGRWAHREPAPHGEPTV